MATFLNIIQKIREITGAISPTFNSRLNFLVKKKRLLNLTNPQTFDEKITWLKLYDYPNNQLVSLCSDKYKVRDYIKEEGLSEILNELYGVWDSPKDIDFSILPQSFVIKWNNDYNSTYVVNDKDSYPISKMVEDLDRKGRQKFYLRAAELHYKNIEPKVIVEKVLVEPNRTVLTDYKLYCYHGNVEYIMVCIGRDVSVKYYFFDKNWVLLRINNDGKNAPENFSLSKPEGLDNMVLIAEKLSKPFKFVRADFYLIEGRIYFGELTFTPASGTDAKLSRELDLMLGEKIHLELGNS